MDDHQTLKTSVVELLYYRSATNLEFAMTNKDKKRSHGGNCTSLNYIYISIKI